MKKFKKILFLALMVAALSCLFCQPAFAISEEEVQAQVDAVGNSDSPGQHIDREHHQRGDNLPPTGFLGMMIALDYVWDQVKADRTKKLCRTVRWTKQIMPLHQAIRLHRNMHTMTSQYF